MRKQINLGKRIHKLVAGILKSDAEGNISAALPGDFPIPSNMMPKPASATNGNLATFDSNKEVVDSGSKVADFAAATHSHDYSPSSHNHDEDYSAIDHDHDSDYSAIDHTHDYVEGPVSSTDAEIAVYDGLTGKLLKGSGAFMATLIAQKIMNEKTGTPLKIWVGTEVEFLLIASPDPDTLYFRGM